MVFRFTWVRFALEGVCAGMIGFAMGTAHELFNHRSRIVNHYEISTEPLFFMVDVANIEVPQLSHHGLALAT